LRGYIKRRLDFNLARFANRLSHVSVRISDGDGPSGGRLYSCRVEVEIRPSSGLLAREVSDPDLYSAIDAASDRIGRALHRTLAWDGEPVAAEGVARARA
jgi:ribosome-associated translation inhibitor RaiA